MRFKLFAVGFSLMACMAMLGAMQPPGPRDDEPPYAKKKRDDFRKKDEVKKKKDEVKKKKGEPGPEGDLLRAYDLLRRLRSENQASGRPEARVRDWTERASRFYRSGIKAIDGGDRRAAHEYGAMAHDLARAVDHARHAMLFDRPDDELPPPPEGVRDNKEDEVERDLREAYDRLQERRGPGQGGEDAKFYRDAASDLYRAALKDAQGKRMERAAELAKASVAMTHVVEHMGHLAEAPPEPRDEVKKRPRFDFPEPKKKGRGGELPPPDID